MTDPTSWMIVATAGLAGLIVATLAAGRAWTGWLDLKRAELDLRHGVAAPPAPAARIELADLKERVRKLEAIAAGVDY